VGAKSAGGKQESKRNYDQDLTENWAMSKPK